MSALKRRARAAADKLVKPTVDQAAAGLSAELVAALRAEMVEVARMLRQQGDAADEVAETLGRTLARLSAEVETLAEAVSRLDRALEAVSDRPPAAEAGAPARSGAVDSSS
jgi:hypothetical protein